MNARRSTKCAARADDLTVAQAVLGRFTQAGAITRAVEFNPKRRVDFSDPFAVRTLELRGRMETDPSSSAHIGAWLCRLKSRGFGYSSALRGAAEGLHVLVLDAQAVAELQEAAAEHRAAVERFSQLQADLAELARRRGDGAEMGGD